MQALTAVIVHPDETPWNSRHRRCLSHHAIANVPTTPASTPFPLTVGGRSNHHFAPSLPPSLAAQEAGAQRSGKREREREEMDSEGPLRSLLLPRRNKVVKGAWEPPADTNSSAGERERKVYRPPPPLLCSPLFVMHETWFLLRLPPADAVFGVWAIKERGNGEEALSHGSDNKVSPDWKC